MPLKRGYMEERIQKLLARAGVGSRRKCEQMIVDGRVRVDGVPAILGQKADPSRARVELDGKPVRLDAANPVYVAVYKPRGVLSTTRDDRGRRTVRDLIPLPGHLFLVGRLDRASEGLVLLTNDGELTDRLTHPRYQHSKEYHVLLDGPLDETALRRWRRGVELDGRRTVPAKVQVLDRQETFTWVRVVLREGRNRQIRRVAEILGCPVARLIRVGIGPVRLGDLRPRRWRHLTHQELGQLRALTNTKES
jgi:pseudouridine synthase